MGLKVSITIFAVIFSILLIGSLKVYVFSEAKQDSSTNEVDLSDKNTFLQTSEEICTTSTEKAVEREELPEEEKIISRKDPFDVVIFSSLIAGILFLAIKFTKNKI